MEFRDVGFAHPNCCETGSSIAIERCHNGNSNFIRITVPGVESAIVMGKIGLRVLQQGSDCEDGCPQLPVKALNPSPFLSTVLLIGYMFYEKETNIHFPPKAKPYQIELTFENTTIEGNSYNSNDELYDELVKVVTDCDCLCSDEVLPCDVIVTNMTSQGVDEEYEITFHVGTSIAETVQLEVFYIADGEELYDDGEEVIVFTSEVVEVTPEAVIVLTAENLNALSDGYIFRFLGVNGESTCNTNIPVAFGEVVTANNETPIEVPLEAYFEEAHGVCDGVSSYLMFLTLYTPGASIVDGELVIEPDETDPLDEIIGNIGLARICDGEVDSIVLVNISYEEIIRPDGLRIGFNNIANMPVGITDATDHTEWNTLFDLPINGTAFTSAYVETNEVVLVGGSNITLKTALFKNNTDIVLVTDETSCVVVAGIECFYGCSNITAYDLPGLTTTLGAPINGGCFQDCTSAVTFNVPALTIAQRSCFAGCTSVVTFNCPALLTTMSYAFYACSSATTFNFALCTTIGDSTFSDCIAATLFNLPACTALGSTSGANGVFDNIIGNTITVNVPIALQTADSGINPDGDLVALAAANTETINYL